MFSRQLLILSFIVLESFANIYKCPIPVRPRAVLSSWQLSEVDSINIALQMRWCFTEDGGRDLFFRLYTSLINRRLPKVEFSGFAAYEYYDDSKFSPPLCYIYLIYSPREEDLNPLGYNTFLCDHLFTKCRACNWTCALPRSQYEDHLVRLFSEMLTPDKSWNGTREDDAQKYNGSKNPYIPDAESDVDSQGEEIESQWINYLIAFVFFVTFCGVMIYFDVC